MATTNFTKNPTVVSIFSGCGGLDLGFHQEGYETIWANDFAEWAVESFKANFGDVIHLRDNNGAFPLGIKFYCCVLLSQARLQLTAVIQLAFTLLVKLDKISETPVFSRLSDLAPIIT